MSEQTKKMQTWVCDREDENVMVIVVGYGDCCRKDITLKKEAPWGRKQWNCARRRKRRGNKGTVPEEEEEATWRMIFYLKLLMSQDIPIPRVWEDEKSIKYYMTNMSLCWQLEVTMLTIISVKNSSLYDIYAILLTVMDES